MGRERERGSAGSMLENFSRKLLQCIFFDVNVFAFLSFQLPEIREAVLSKEGREREREIEQKSRETRERVVRERFCARLQLTLVFSFHSESFQIDGNAFVFKQHLR